MKKNVFILLLVWVTCSIACLAQSEQKPTKPKKMYVLSVGINDYASEAVMDLRNTANDADSIYNVFKDEPNCVRMLLKNEEAIGDSLKAKMERFFGQSTDVDKIVFFFSGHGYSNGFCCQDYRVSPTGTLSYDELKAIFKNIKAQGRIIIADACMAGGLRTNKAKENTDTTKVQRQPGDKQVMLFLSSRGNELSWENPRETNGFFTKYLLEGLHGAADVNNNGVITVNEIATYVSTKLDKLVLPNGVKQHSNVWGNFDKRWIIKRNTKK